MNQILNDLEIKNLLEKGFFLKENFLPTSIQCELLAEINRLKKLNVFERAHIGKNQLKRVNENIRSDSLAWIENFNEINAFKLYREKIDSLAHDISKNFFLTLRSFEAHFSFYSQGEFYLKHLDQHKNSRHRQVTVVLYLSTLKEGEGGELILYDKDDCERVLERITPVEGRLVAFFSSWLYHEVKPSLKDRYSLTGWLRDDDELGFS